MCLDRRKNHGCGQKKPEGTSSAIFGVGTAAKCCELKRCADRVCSRNDNKSEDLEGNFDQKDKNILLEFFFPLITFFYFLLSVAKTQVNMQFRDKNAGYSTGLSHRACHLILVTLWWRRTDGHVTITSLLKFLSLMGY